MDTEMTTRKTFTIGQVWPEFVKRLPRTQPRYRIELGPNPFAAVMQSELADLQATAFQSQQINAQQYAGSLYGLSSAGLWNPLGIWPPRS